MKLKKYIIGVYEEDAILCKAAQNLRKQGIQIHEVFTPYPVHGLDDALGYKRSKLAVAAFFFGFLGLFLALFMQYYMLGLDWPMNIGGKDTTPLLTFIPVAFEVTVLLAALGMVGVFMFLSKLKPYSKPTIFDPRSTDDKLIMVIDLTVNTLSEETIQAFLKNNGASEINIKIIEIENT